MRRNLQETNRAYAAGIFDGEGCISSRHKIGPPLISITQKDRSLLEWLQEVTGVGSIYPQRDLFQYRIANRRDLQTFIRYIYPYTRLEPKRTKLKRAYYYKYRRLMGAVIQ